MIRKCLRRRCSLRSTVMLLLLSVYMTCVMIFWRVDSYLFEDDQLQPDKYIPVPNSKRRYQDVNVQRPVVSGEEDKRHVVNNEKWSRKPYSPNAVFKEGILGNYEPELHMKRTGPGEYGVPVETNASEKDAADKTFKEFGFNMVNSDKISLDRMVKDLRNPELLWVSVALVEMELWQIVSSIHLPREDDVNPNTFRCKYWHYPEKLPSASVILVFHNEGWSTFVRTVHSVINMSPPQHLHEVLLVDDGSDKEHLKSRLEEHMTRFGNKVKIIRNKNREGLIRARSIGARAASGDVVVFLDAHCECSPNWLPPLLTRIAYDSCLCAKIDLETDPPGPVSKAIFALRLSTIMAAPVIDSIDWSHFNMHSNYNPNEPYRGIFEWGFFYKEIQVPKNELDKRQHSTEPYWSATNAGGLFAIDREYFLLLGAYDPQLELWGGENFELAFKLWQCGGASEWVPCSRVGHIYRLHGPDRKMKITTKLSPTLINYVRVVEVWMDEEFKEYFYRREPQARGYPTDISKELQFEKDNHCRSFKWFMENVAYDVYRRYPPPVPNKAWGKIKLREPNGTRCLAYTTQHHDNPAIGTYHCDFISSTFRLGIRGQIGDGERCLLAMEDSVITREWCDTVSQTGPWRWEETSGKIYNRDRHKCISMKANGKGVHLADCDSNSADQKWDIIEYYPWK